MRHIIHVMKLYAVAFMLTGCTTQLIGIYDEPHVLIASPDESVTLDGKVIIKADTVMGKDKIDVVGNYLVATSVDNTKAFFSVYSLDGKYVTSFGAEGHAANEFSQGIHVVEAQGDDAFWVNDVNQACLKLVDLAQSIKTQSCVVKQTVPTASRSINSFAPLNGSCWMEQETDNNYQLCRKNVSKGTIEQSIDLYKPTQDVFQTYYSKMIMNEDKTAMASAMIYINQVNFLALGGDAPEKHSASLYTEAKMPDNSGDMSKRTYYYCGLAGSSRYVYALYNNQSCTEAFQVKKPMEIHVFDWKGDFVKKLCVKDYIICGIAVDKNDKNLYAADNEGNVYKYSLE